MFGFGMRMLIKPWWFSCWWAGLAPSQRLRRFSCPASAEGHPTCFPWGLSLSLVFSFITIYCYCYYYYYYFLKLLLSDLTFLFTSTTPQVQCDNWCEIGRISVGGILRLNFKKWAFELEIKIVLCAKSSKHCPSFHLSIRVCTGTSQTTIFYS